MAGGKRAQLAALRQRLAALETGGKEVPVLPFGVAAIDASLPWGGLPLGALHEFGGAGVEGESGAVAAAFLAGILARLGPDRPVLWCLKRADLHAPGLALHGLAPERLILARARNDQEILWAMEEGLHSAALAAVIGEVEALSAPASRRLQLAAETSGITGFVLPRQSLVMAASSAVTRWRLAALPGSLASGGEPGVGQPLWRVELLRCRGGVPAAWDVEACDATGLVALSAALADRSAPLQRRAVG
jgi:protein ImuA